MAQRQGDVVLFTEKPAVLGQAAVGGATEAKGPLGRGFAEIFEDCKAGEDNWEMAESHLQQAAMYHAMQAAGCTADEIDLHFGGDLLNQCTATNFALRALQIPCAGVYAACASFALALALGALAVDGGGFNHVSAGASSHFCAAEKQFRFPLEYGCMPTPTAQRTATAAGAVILGAYPTKTTALRKPRKEDSLPSVSGAVFGRVMDLGVKDANSMGAAMAPAAWDTLRRFLEATKTQPDGYDMILTGDLGEVGTALLCELARREANLELAGVHRDGGTMLYNTLEQDAGTGGSGVGCSAAVICGEILPGLREGRYKRVLYLGTGALLSAISPLQGETIPAVCHGVLFEGVNA
jgi:stage V sporulation protein AD